MPDKIVLKQSMVLRSPSGRRFRCPAGFLLPGTAEHSHSQIVWLVVIHPGPFIDAAAHLEVLHAGLTIVPGADARDDDHVVIGFPRLGQTAGFRDFSSYKKAAPSRFIPRQPCAMRSP